MTKEEAKKLLTNAVTSATQYSSDKDKNPKDIILIVCNEFSDPNCTEVSDTQKIEIAQIKNDFNNATGISSFKSMLKQPTIPDYHKFMTDLLIVLMKS